MPPDLYVPSLLVRLTDDHETPTLQNKRDWERTLLTEVELLLNTKRASEEVPEGFKYTSQSLPMYGLPDCTSMSVKDPDHQAELRRAIETALRHFEPRLTSVTVVMEPVVENEPTLRFSIEALARREPESEPIRFETVLQTDRSQFVVRKDRG